MTSDTATDPTPSGPVPAAKKKTAKAAAAPKTAPDAGQKLLDQLGTDAPPITPTDPVLYSRGSVISAIALHASPDLWTRVAAYNHPGSDDPAVTGTDPVDIEIFAVSIPALDQIVGALPWMGQPSTRRDVDPVSGRTHIVTRGVLWGVLVAVAGIEPVGGAA